jgi:hypothetical protein
MKHGICDVCRKVVHVGLDGKMVMQRLTYPWRGKRKPDEGMMSLLFEAWWPGCTLVPIHFDCIPGTVYDVRRREYTPAPADVP